MNDNRIQALKTAAKMKRETSIKKMNDAISKMHSEGLSISICSVATYAGVARSWIYNNPELKAIIESYRKNNDKINRILDLRAQLDTRDKRILTLINKNKVLRERIKKLRHQLDVVYGQLYTSSKN